MSRELKALLLETLCDDPEFKAMIRAELEHNDPIIDLRFDVACRADGMIV